MNFWRRFLCFVGLHDWCLIKPMRNEYRIDGCCLRIFEFRCSECKMECEGPL